MRRRPKLIACVIGVVAVLLSSCATRETRIAAPADAPPAGELQDWTARGRLAVASSVQSGSGSFTWTQHAADASVQLRGPVGVGSLSLTMQNEVPYVVTGDGQQWAADAALGELQARLGAPLPIAQLRYWLRALPAPGAHRWLADTVLQQDGWQIEYNEFAQHGALRLPVRLNATQRTPEGELRIRVVIELWRLDARPGAIGKVLPH